jgi:hypothetical protein
MDWLVRPDAPRQAAAPHNAPAASTTAMDAQPPLQKWETLSGWVNSQRSLRHRQNITML